ncbi:MAG: hypothetical protein IPO93_03275 [Actinobacteria bacterium]|nr:hypothetical protein [Actinomycetota bacterium]
MGSLFDTIGGLPVHSLVVHAVVVLVPLVALGAILMAFWPSFSRRFGTLIVVVAAGAAAASVVAKESGEQLAGRVGSPEPHVDLGSRMPLFAIGLFLVLLVFWLFDRGIPMNRPRPTWLKLLAALLVVVSLAATGWVIRVGHTGSQAVWTGVIEKTQPKSG